MRNCWLYMLAGALASVGCGAGDGTADALSGAPASAGDAVAAQADLKPVEDRVKGKQVTAILRLAKPVAYVGQTIEVVVELRIAPLWEIHALDAQPAATATKLELTVPTGIVVQDDWKEPKTTRSMSPSGQPVHVGRALFKRTLLVDAAAEAGTHEVECRVNYQACNERQCLKPEELTLRVPVVVLRPLKRARQD